MTAIAVHYTVKFPRGWIEVPAEAEAEQTVELVASESLLTVEGRSSLLDSLLAARRLVPADGAVWLLLRSASVPEIVATAFIRFFGNAGRSENDFASDLESSDRPQHVWSRQIEFASFGKTKAVVQRDLAVAEAEGGLGSLFERHVTTIFPVGVNTLVQLEVVVSDLAAADVVFEMAGGIARSLKIQETQR